MNHLINLMNYRVTMVIRYLFEDQNENFLKYIVMFFRAFHLLATCMNFMRSTLNRYLLETRKGFCSVWLVLFLL